MSLLVGHYTRVGRQYTQCARIDGKSLSLPRLLALNRGQETHQVEFACDSRSDPARSTNVMLPTSTESPPSLCGEQLATAAPLQLWVPSPPAEAAGADVFRAAAGLLSMEMRTIWCERLLLLFMRVSRT
jgi:hypothetical protein